MLAGTLLADGHYAAIVAFFIVLGGLSWKALREENLLRGEFARVRGTQASHRLFSSAIFLKKDSLWAPDRHFLSRPRAYPFARVDFPVPC